MQCEQDITVFVLRIKYLSAAKDQQDKCHQVKKDVEQEVTHDLANAGHEDEMSATKYHQPDYLYKSDDSNVIDSFVLNIYIVKQQNWVSAIVEIKELI